MTITYKVEEFTDQASLTRVVKECLDSYAEHWVLGLNRRGPEFNPDLDGSIASIAGGTRVFITARRDGKIVGLQNWYVGVNQDIRTERIAYMTGIGRKDNEVDLKEFVSFGVVAMRKRGATRTILTARVGVASMRPLFESMGARPVDVLMEV